MDQFIRGIIEAGIPKEKLQYLFKIDINKFLEEYYPSVVIDIIKFLARFDELALSALVSYKPVLEDARNFGFGNDDAEKTLLFRIFDDKKNDEPHPSRQEGVSELMFSILNDKIVKQQIYYTLCSPLDTSSFLTSTDAYLPQSSKRISYSIIFGNPSKLCVRVSNHAVLDEIPLQINLMKKLASEKLEYALNYVSQKIKEYNELYTTLKQMLTNGS